MKNEQLLVLAAGLLVWTGALPAGAADKPGAGEQRMQGLTEKVDKQARRPEGRRAVRESLRQEFKVSDDRLLSLRDDGLSYGEIMGVLSMAEKMEGGLTTKNMQKVMDAHPEHSKPGWAKVARDQHMDLNSVADRMDKAEVEAIENEKEGPHHSGVETPGKDDLTEEMEENTPGHESMEKMEKPERPERVEMPEKPEIEMPEKTEMPEKKGM